jgi:hypothetical protein
MYRRGRRQIDLAEKRRALRRRGRWLLLGALGLLGPAALPGPASATGSYPGETLSLTQSGPAVVGKAANFLATGQQADVDEYAGGFGLDVFEKDPTVDPTCSPSFWDESNNSITNPSELHFIVGDWEGPGTTFSVPFKAVYSEPGPVLLCAYSTWITDTAASAQLTVDVTSPAPPPSSGSTPARPSGHPIGPTNPATVAKPVNTAPPHLTRVHNRLSCSRGAWLNGPRSFSFRWLAGTQRLRGAKKSRLIVARSLRGRRVQCSVSATNSAGTTTVLSRPLFVR